LSRPSSINLGLAVPPSEVLDPAMWRARYAWGIALGAAQTRDRGSLYSRLEAARCRDSEVLDELDDDEAALTKFVGDIPDDVIRWHLRAAMSEAEYALGMPMGINVCKARPADDGLVLGTHFDELVPRLPYTRTEAHSFFRIDLPRRGIISVERIRAFYYGTETWDISNDNGTLDQIKLEWTNEGTLHIIPTNLEALVISSGGNWGVWDLINTGGRSPVPDFWAVDFTYGPVTRDGQVGKIPSVLANWIYCAAGLLVLGQSGMAQSRGLTNTSISIDGISRSVGLSASAQAGLYGALEKSYDAAMQRIDFKKLRAQMRGLRLRPY
jgi:hypothetical protein